MQSPKKTIAVKDATYLAAKKLSLAETRTLTSEKDEDVMIYNEFYFIRTSE